MMHANRTYAVAEVSTAEELAAKLTDCTWCGCNGFRFGSTLWLNDSTGPDGAQEYAVAREESPGVYRQIESITVSWCDAAKVAEYARRYAGTDPGVACFGALAIRVEPSAGHRCYLCA